MDKVDLYGYIFIVLTFFGFLLAYFYGRKTKKFKWSEYVALLILPVIFIPIAAYAINQKIIAIFLISAVLGFFLEYIAGLAYHKTLNQRLWTYNRLSVGGYTSLLCVPMWGILGVFLWFLNKILNF